MDKNVISVLLIVIITFIAGIAPAQDGKLPIIDVHLHSYTAERYYVAPDNYGEMAPETLAEHRDQTMKMLKKYNIVKAVVSQIGGGKIDLDDEGILIPGYYTTSSPKDTIAFKQLIEDGKMKVFGEIGAIYAGKTLSDPEFDPYLKICERYDIPVMVHTGGAAPNITYMCCPGFRLKLGDPLLVEDVLAKYPKLRLCIMHAGETFHREALRLMLLYPQLYADLGVILWVDRSTKVYAERFLKDAKDFGLLDRIMFGSDQMVWPKGIEKSIKTLNSYDFLSFEEKRKIFYHNAVKFLNLENEPGHSSKK